MRKGGGKVKGNIFEIEISKKISLLLSEGERDDILWKSQNSGGRHTTRMKDGIETYGQDGDLTAVHPNGILFREIISVEAKHYKDLGLWSLFTETKECLLDFWKQAYMQGKSAKKIPVLIAKQNFKPVLFVTHSLIKQFIYEPKVCEPKSRFYIPEGPIDIYFFDDFLRINSHNFLYNIDKMSQQLEQLYMQIYQDI